MTIAIKDLAAGIAVVILAAVILWATTSIPPPPPYARIGPAFIGYIVGIGLVGLGGMLIVAAFHGGWSHANEEELVRPDLPALAWVALGLFLNVAFIGNLGFVISSTLMFLCVARAFGSRRVGRDLIVAVILTLAAYIGFDKALGINIGGGVLEGLI